MQQRLPVVKHPHCTGKHHLEQGTLWAPTGSGALPESYCVLELELSSFDLFTLSQTVIDSVLNEPLQRRHENRQLSLDHCDTEGNFKT